MDNDEQEAILHRLDERTEHIQDSFERFDKRLDHQQEQIKENRALSERNKTKMSAGIYTGGALITALAARLMGYLTW